MLVKCKFLNEQKEPKGREYTYCTNDDVVLGEVVKTEDGKEVLITQIGIDDNEVINYKDKLKYINKLEPSGDILITNDSLEENNMTFEDIIVEKNVSEDFIINDLIVTKQLPIIEQKLKLISEKIDNKIKSAISLVCNDETVKEIKNIRAELNKDFNILEMKRKQVKNEIMTPYEQFELTYKQFVSEKFENADIVLKNKINAVEDELRKTKETEVENYFDEYLLSKEIDFITFDKVDINVTLSASLKSLKEKVKMFIDKIADDISLIELHEFKEEIFVEYKKTLNCSRAVTNVVSRHKAIEEQKAKQIEIEQKKKAKEEASAKIENIVPAPKPISPPKEVVQAVQPVQQNAAEQQPKAVAQNSVRTLSFKVTAPISKLKELKKFLDDGGYIYE